MGYFWYLIPFDSSDTSSVRGCEHSSRLTFGHNSYATFGKLLPRLTVRGYVAPGTLPSCGAFVNLPRLDARGCAVCCCQGTLLVLVLPLHTSRFTHESLQKGYRTPILRPRLRCTAFARLYACNLCHSIGETLAIPQQKKMVTCCEFWVSSRVLFRQLEREFVREKARPRFALALGYCRCAVWVLEVQPISRPTRDAPLDGPNL